MKEQECSFRDKRVFQFSSAKKYIKFFVTEFHDYDKNISHDDFFVYLQCHL